MYNTNAVFTLKIDVLFHISIESRLWLAAATYFQVVDDGFEFQMKTNGLRLPAPSLEIALASPVPYST